MTDLAPSTNAMRTVRFHDYGEPQEVLRYELAPIPEAQPNRIRIVVHACGLNPADWALCRGLFKGDLPRGIGCDVAGVVDAIGAGVTDAKIGDPVFGTADWAQCASAGASERAIMDHWFAIPNGLGFTQAAALPMPLATAYWHLTRLGLTADQTVLIHGAGSSVGFAAAQIALIRGAKVIATAGDTYAQRLRDLGAKVVAYGDGMVERVQALTDRPVDIILDAAPVGGSLPALIEIAGGHPKSVLTISDFKAAQELGVRDTFHEDPETRTERFDSYPEFAQLAAEGRFEVPVARIFRLEQWMEALELSLSGNPHGKLILIPESLQRG